MKKIIAVSVLFGVLTGGLFAQVTLSGEFHTGVELNIPSEGDESIKINHREEGFRVFDLAATVNKDNFGAKLDTYFVNQTADFFNLAGAFGWAYFLDKQIRLTMGKISDAAWVTSLGNEHKLDDVEGFRLNYTPLRGLNVGVAFKATDYTMEQFAKQAVFGASYVHELFNTVAAYDLGGNANAIFGFNFTGLDQLTTAGIELKGSELALWDKTGSLMIDEEVGYQITGEFTAVLHLGQILHGKSGTDPELLFRPGVRYKILPPLTVFLDVELGSVDMFETMNVVAHPWIEYSLGNMGLLYLEYELSLPDMKDPSHLIGFGMEIKAF
jgi:hypothetical protein